MFVRFRDLLNALRPLPLVKVTISEILYRRTSNQCTQEKCLIKKTQKVIHPTSDIRRKGFSHRFIIKNALISAEKRTFIND